MSENMLFGAGKTKTVLVATTATGDAEVYTHWREWPTVRERYADVNRVACLAVRAFLAAGYEVRVEVGDTDGLEARVSE